jgi:hypothetical protein
MISKSGSILAWLIRPVPIFSKAGQSISSAASLSFKWIASAHQAFGIANDVEKKHVNDLQLHFPFDLQRHGKLPIIALKPPSSSFSFDWRHRSVVDHPPCVPAAGFPPSLHLSSCFPFMF